MSANLIRLPFPEYIVHFWDRLAEKYAKESGEACKSLFDHDKYFSLKTKEDRELYSIKSCVIRCKIFSTIPFDKAKIRVEVTSRPYIRSSLSPTNCNERFSKTENLVKKQFISFQEKIYGKK